MNPIQTIQNFNKVGPCGRRVQPLKTIDKTTNNTGTIPTYKISSFCNTGWPPANGENKLLTIFNQLQNGKGTSCKFALTV